MVISIIDGKTPKAVAPAKKEKSKTKQRSLDSSEMDFNRVCSKV